MVNKAATADSAANSAIFKAKSLTLSQHVDYDEDHLPPALGRLNPKSLSQPDALSGVQPGTDTTWIKGIKTLLVDENLIANIKGFERRDVFEDQTETIHGETKLTYVHGRDVSVGDEDNLAVNGRQEKFVEASETFLKKEETQDGW